ncbi:MAG TPA: NAD-dependent epimerase/dehydratase family protein [Gammaproteobacteria bacterium]|nr:NAD-dependent epimerase/dehydratase family protein [Gammaproteobacteria bacterium]
MDLRGKRILVTGGAGFIGSHTVDALLREDVAEVVIYDNFSSGHIENLKGALSDGRCRVFEDGGEILHGDTFREALRKVDGVFHLAAAWLLHCEKYTQTAFEVNVRGTFNVLEACIDMGVSRLVFASSASVYGDATETPMTEEHPFNNITFYGATKIASEAMIKAMCNRRELACVGLRYMNVYGPRQDGSSQYSGVIARMMHAATGGRPIQVFGSGKQSYDFVDVRDCARANVLAMKSDMAGFFNVGTGIATSVSDLASAIRHLTGASVSRVSAPESPITLRVAATKRAAADLGFKSTIDLRHGLEDLWNHIVQGSSQREMPDSAGH